MKKLLAFMISLSMFFTSFSSIYANDNNNLELIGALKNADKVKLIQNNDNFGEAYAVFKDLKSTIKWNKKTNEVNFRVENLKTKNILDESTFNIKINEDFEPIGKLEYNKEKYDIQDIDVNVNSRFALGLPAILGSALISALVAASTTVVIAGVTYVLATKVAAKLRRKEPKHYQAAIRYSKKLKRNELFIGDSLGEKGASGRLKAGNDVWSISKSGAEKIARLAGGNRKPVGAEKHGGGKPGYYWHYHTYNRQGGHSFF